MFVLVTREGSFGRYGGAWRMIQALAALTSESSLYQYFALIYVGKACARPFTTYHE